MQHFCVAHGGKIYHLFGAGIAKTALLAGCHFMPVFVAWLRNGELYFWLHNSWFVMRMRRIVILHKEVKKKSAHNFIHLDTPGIITRCLFFVYFIQSWAQAFFAFVKYHHAFVNSLSQFFLCIFRQVINSFTFGAAAAIVLGCTAFALYKK